MEEEATTWVNQSTPTSAPTLEEIEALIKGLPDPHKLLAYFEVGDQGLAQWLFGKLRESYRSPAFLFGMPDIRINEVMGPHAFLSRNRFDEPLDLFIRKDDGSLLCLDVRRKALDQILEYSVS